MEKYFTIVSDGSCDLPEEIVKEKEIGEVHFLVSFDGKEYKKEGVEIRLEDFYGKMVAESNVFPLTAAPSPNDYYEVFKEKKYGWNVRTLIFIDSPQPPCSRFL